MLIFRKLNLVEVLANRFMLILTSFLNQVRAGPQPMYAWFLEITLVRMSVCV